MTKATNPHLAKIPPLDILGKPVSFITFTEL
jgi:hypothetical protein